MAADPLSCLQGTTAAAGDSRTLEPLRWAWTHWAPRRTGVADPRNNANLECKPYGLSALYSGDPELLDYDSVSQATAPGSGQPSGSGPCCPCGHFLTWAWSCLNQAEVDLLGVDGVLYKGE